MAVRLASRLLGAAAVAAMLAKDVASSDLDAELMEGLASDEVCQGEDAEACGLELRQLRAQERKSEVSKHQREHTAMGEKDEDEAGEGEEAEAYEPEPASALQVDTSFGPDNEGTNMWLETTWNDILLEFESKVNGSSTCNRDTGGSCSVFSCGASRGPTECFSHKCTCGTGYCAFSGACVPMNSQCEANTGGTCSVGSCSSSRGQTKCKSGNCMCKTGGCAWMGKCWPITDTSGSCSVMSCASSRGPTTCHRGRCICKNGFVSVNGKCTRYNH